MKQPYTKGDAYREPNEIVKNVVSSNARITHESVTKLKSNYTKPDGVLTSALFIIISGGEKRERDYFKRIGNTSTFPRIRIHFIAETDKGESGLSPDKMYDEAVNIKDRIKDSSFKDELDTIVMVTDVDHFMDSLVKIKPSCKENNIKLIISNPCFEIWLYYGEISNKPSDFELPNNPLKISSCFKTYLGDTIKGGINPTKAIHNIHLASKNARDNFTVCDKDIPTLFSTNMFELSDLILPLIDIELQAHIESIEKTRQERKSSLL